MIFPHLQCARLSLKGAVLGDTRLIVYSTPLDDGLLEESNCNFFFFFVPGAHNKIGT